MSKPFDVREKLAIFTGWAPLFPLPNVVHFPHLLLPLHIFEPRYREMVGFALDSDRMIAMALLKPGFASTDGSPPIHDVVCLGRITAEQRMPDGRFYLVLQGLSRAQVLREASGERPYRVAELELHPDQETVGSKAAADAQRLRLIGTFRKLFPRRELDRILRRAVDESVPLGVLCDVLADAMGLEAQIAHEVLAEFNVNRRCRLVLRLMQEKLSRRLQAAKTTWPPKFSLN
jgi:uncharacterized protein